jgi:hypothetical protein
LSKARDILKTKDPLKKMGKTFTKERMSCKKFGSQNFNVSNLGLITIKLFFGRSIPSSSVNYDTKVG